MSIDLTADAFTAMGDAAYLPGRMVLSPAAGDWEPGAFGDLQRWTPSTVAAGDVLGTIGGDDVVSPIAGRLAGMLVLAGERLRTGEPIAWVVPA
jgi:hypothetical protein